MRLLRNGGSQPDFSSAFQPVLMCVKCTRMRKVNRSTSLAVMGLDSDPKPVPALGFWPAPGRFCASCSIPTCTEAGTCAGNLSEFTISCVQALLVLLGTRAPSVLRPRSRAAEVPRLQAVSCHPVSSTDRLQPPTRTLGHTDLPPRGSSFRISQQKGTGAPHLCLMFGWRWIPAKRNPTQAPSKPGACVISWS